MIEIDLDALESIANDVIGWSNCNQSWLDYSEDEPAAVVGHIDEDGNRYPVATIDCDQYDAAEDSIKLARFYAEANPAIILELISRLREAEAKLAAELTNPEAEPVAQVVEYSKFTDVEWISDIPPDGTLLYTLPRSMQRLTESKPVGYQVWFGANNNVFIFAYSLNQAKSLSDEHGTGKITPVYSSPRPMHRLTDDEIKTCVLASGVDYWHDETEQLNKPLFDFANAIMDAMIEKNK